VVVRISFPISILVFAFLRMELQEAIELIAFDPGTKPQLWLDLGSGSGLFTLALANYLPAGSLIRAMDKDRRLLKKIPSRYKNTDIETIAADFIRLPTIQPKADGVFMANSLHYVQDKKTFIEKIVNALQSAGSILLVEYDMKRANQWVPFPMPVTTAMELFKEAGFSSFEVIRRRKSIYGSHDMYAALIKRM
jgi:ubiquinone/menaquinone biosynthesis C-methylase UbiE